jgi:FkbM family methyltransferase
VASVHPTATAGSRWLQQLESGRSAQALKDSLRGSLPFLRDGLPARLAVLGAGGEGKRLATLCQGLGIEVAGVFDNDATKRGTVIGKCRVAPFDALSTFDRAIPVIIASHRVLGSTSSLRAMGFAVTPFATLQVLEPERFAPHMFYDGLLDNLHQNKHEIAWLANQLADAASLRVLDRVVGYRMSLDAQVLAEVVDWDLYGFSGILQFGSDEVYVDGGAFDGDSIRMFLEHVAGKYQRILGFEPDAGTFARLQKNLHGLEHVDLFNCGLHERQARLGFSNDGSRGSIISADADFHIEVAGLDEILDGGKVSFIKMNIEGAEPDALRGAARSIAKWRPKLALSAYHRPSDLWALAKQVRALVPDYKLYLRQHDGGIIETVLYAHV